MAFVDRVVERLFAKLFVVVAAKADFQIVDSVFAYTFEVVFAPAGIQYHVGNELIILLQVVEVSRADEDGHLFINLRAEARCHRVHRVDYLLVAHRAAAAA